MKIFASIIISLLLAFSVSGQGNITPDTVKGKFIPTGVRLGFDLINAGQAVIKNGVKAITQGEYRELQFSADIDFYRYFLNVEYGIFEREWIRDDGFYNNKGVHYKIGPDVNFLHRDPDGAALFFGLRYAFTKFSDDMNYQYSNGFWGNGGNSISNKDIKADWFEITTGLKVPLTKIIWLGYTARVKLGAGTFEDQALIPYWVPGYGRADRNTAWGLDYWLILRIPLKKSK